MVGYSYGYFDGRDLLKVGFLLALLESAILGIDGWVARRFNQCSAFGAYIDPIADKALLLTGIITLSLVDWGTPGWHLPLWFAAIVVLRDCIILGGIKILYCHRREVKIVPHWTGKVCTVTQMFALGWVMLKVVPIPPTWPCIIAGFFTLWSTVAYIQQGIRILSGALDVFSGRRANRGINKLLCNCMNFIDR